MVTGVARRCLSRGVSRCAYPRWARRGWRRGNKKPRWCGGAGGWWRWLQALNTINPVRIQIFLPCRRNADSFGGTLHRFRDRITHGTSEICAKTVRLPALHRLLLARVAVAENMIFVCCNVPAMWARCRNSLCRNFYGTTTFKIAANNEVFHVHSRLCCGYGLTSPASTKILWNFAPLISTVMPTAFSPPIVPGC